MKRLRQSLSIFVRASLSSLLLLFLSSCDEPMVYNELRYGDFTGDIWNGHNPNDILIRCGKDCTTLTFAKISVPVGPRPPQFQADLTNKIQMQQQMIKGFLSKQDRSQPVYIAPCDTWPVQTRENQRLAQWAANQVTKAGYSAWITRPVLSNAENVPVLCVNLVRGHLSIILPNCPNLRVKDTVYHISSDFGCSTNRSMATIISNPWDLLVPPGQHGPVPGARIVRGNMRYNKGEVANLLIEKPSQISADNNTNNTSNNNDN